MYTITKEFWFSASHRIEGHPKCGRLHGHNYKVTVVITGLVGENGMVMDFGEVKQAVKPIIDSFDHYTLFSQSNIIKEPELFDLCREKGWAVALPIHNTTAEELAQYIHAKVCAALHITPNKLAIKIEETQESHSTAVYEG